MTTMQTRARATEVERTRMAADAAEAEVAAQEVEAERVETPRPIGPLLRELGDEAVTLVRKEIELARSEMNEKVQEAQHAAAASAGGVAMLVAGLITLCGAASAGLYVLMLLWNVQPAISLWVSPLVVGVIVMLIGWGMASRARKLTSARHWRPTHTERSLRETKQWAERKL